MPNVQSKLSKKSNNNQLVQHSDVALNPNNRNINDFPNEILLNIFKSFANLNEVFILCIVCPRWAGLFKKRLLTTYDLRLLIGGSLIEEVKDQSNRVLGQFGNEQQMRRNTLCFWTLPTPKLAKQLARYLPNIRSLSIRILANETRLAETVSRFEELMQAFKVQLVNLCAFVLPVYSRNDIKSKGMHIDTPYVTEIVKSLHCLSSLRKLAFFYYNCDNDHHECMDEYDLPIVAHLKKLIFGTPGSVTVPLEILKRHAVNNASLRSVELLNPSYDRCYRQEVPYARPNWNLVFRKYNLESKKQIKPNRRQVL